MWFKMKLKIILSFLMMLLIVGFANASHTQYGSSTYGNQYGYGYDPYGGSGSYSGFNPSMNSFDFSAGRSDFSQDFNQFYNGNNNFNSFDQYSKLFGQNGGYTGNYNNFQNSNNAGFVSSLDGFDLDLVRCTTAERRVVIDLKGKDPKLREFIKVCGPLEGNLYRNNAFGNTFSNNNGYNNAYSNQDNF